MSTNYTVLLNILGYRSYIGETINSTYLNSLPNYYWINITQDSIKMDNTTSFKLPFGNISIANLYGVRNTMYNISGCTLDNGTSNIFL